MLAGGAVERMAVFALNIMPYISASIIVQLMTTAIPSWEKLKKEGEAGRKQINQYTRYLTVVLALAQAFMVATSLNTVQTDGTSAALEPGIYFPGRWGARIEDIVVVTEDGALAVNNRPRELIVVPAS